jgi:hypothetical protein
LAGEKKAEKLVITPELRRIWLGVRTAWNLGFQQFSSSLSALDERQAGLLYGLVRLSLFKGSYVEMLREHPELRPLLISDDDRLCMHDAYEVLAWRLNRSEELPREVRISQRMKGRIGREAPDLTP